MRGNTLNSIYIILMGGKTLLGYYFKTLLKEYLKYLSCPICHLNYLLYLYITYIKLYAYPSSTPPYIYYLQSPYLQYNLVLLNSLI